MLKGFAVQSKIVRTDKHEGDLIDLSEAMPKIELPSKETVQEVSHEVIKKSAFAIVGVIIAAAVARTASEIIIHHATK